MLRHDVHRQPSLSALRRGGRRNESYVALYFEVSEMQERHAADYARRLSDARMRNLWRLVARGRGFRKDLRRSRASGGRARFGIAGYRKSHGSNFGQNQSTLLSLTSMRPVDEPDELRAMLRRDR